MAGYGLAFLLTLAAGWNFKFYRGQKLFWIVAAIAGVLFYILFEFGWKILVFGILSGRLLQWGFEQVTQRRKIQ